MAQVKPVKKNKMSKPSLIAMIIAIVMLVALAVSLIAGSGFFFRVKKGASSDDFKVNAAMMEYYANSYYQNWYSQNYYYILLGYTNFDPSKPLNEQYTDTTKTQTWYDYFVTSTKTTVETYLKYCEAAQDDSSVDFKQLKKDAKEYANDSIKLLKDASKEYSKQYYETYGSTVSFADYIRQNFGEHVSKSDLKKALVIEHIANAYYQIVYERVNGAVDGDREDKYFEDNLSSFVTAEYLVYTLSSLKTVEFPKAEDYDGGENSTAYKAAIEGKTPEQIQSAKIDPEDYVGGEESKAYKEAYKKAQENKLANQESLATDEAIINRLVDATTVEEFKRILLEENYKTNFTTAFNSAVNKFNAYNKLSTEALEAFMATIKAEIIDATLADDSDIDAALIKLDELKLAFLNDRYSAHFDNAYNAAVKNFEKDNKPSEEILNAFKTEELKNAIIDAVVNGKETLEDDTLLVFPEGASDAWKEAAKELPKTIIKSLKTGAEEWEKAAKALPASVITNLNKVITNATKTETYTLTTELGQKLFGGVKEQFGIEYEENETKTESAVVNEVWSWNMLDINIKNYERSIKVTEDAIAELNEEIATATGDAKTTLEKSKKALEDSLTKLKENLETAKEKLANVETTGDYSYSAYIVTKAAHRDETKPRDVGHILFKVDSTKDTDAAVSYKTSAEAKAAALKLLAEIEAASVDGKISKEQFEEFAKNTHDSSVFYDAVTTSTDFVDEFKDWLFYDATTVGQVGLVKTTYGWHIMYFADEVEDGDIAWRTNANTGATNEDVSTWYAALPSYGIEFNDDIFADIFGIDDSHEGHNH